MDKQQQIVSDCAIHAAVLGHPDKAGKFALVFLDGMQKPGLEYASRYAVENGLDWCGILGFNEETGQCLSACEENASAVITCMAASFTFARYVAERLKGKPGSVEWLRALYSLPDNRPLNT